MKPQRGARVVDVLQMLPVHAAGLESDKARAHEAKELPRHASPHVVPHQHDLLEQQRELRNVWVRLRGDGLVCDARECAERARRASHTVVDVEHVLNHRVRGWRGRPVHASDERLD